MGMFDTIKIDLPLEEGAGEVFQTKDLDMFMQDLRVDERGLLYVLRYDEEELGPPRPGVFGMMIRNVRRVNERWVPYAEVFTNEPPIHQYALVYRYNPDGTWLEYRLKFTDGVCVEHRRVRTEDI